MKKCLCALLLFPAVLYPQFQNLFTTFLGDTVYFSTRLRLRGSEHLPWPKVYRWDSSGFELVEQNSYGRDSRGPLSGWQVIGASASGDGRVVAVNSWRPCKRGAPCVSASQEFTGIWFNGALVERFAAYAQVSRNGRHVALNRRTGLGWFSPSPDLRPRDGVSRYDLEGNSLERLGVQPARFGHWVSVDGSILVLPFRSSGVVSFSVIAPSGEKRSLGEAPQDLHRAVLADDASFIVYQAAPDSPWQAEPVVTELRIRFADGQDRLLAEQGAWPSIAAALPRILYLGPVDEQLQGFLLEDPRGMPRQVTFEEQGILEAVISGDGQIAYATTAQGELLRIELGTLRREEVIGRTPDLRIPLVEELFHTEPHIEPPRAPGSTYRLPVSHLPTEIEVAAPPLPQELAGVRVTLAGEPARVYWVSPWEVGYQVAWETPLSSEAGQVFEELTLEGGDPEWEIVAPIRQIKPKYPVGEYPAIHGDWRGFVTEADRAVPGEYVHIYTSGLGPVEPAVPTGQAAPVSPLARVTPRPDCFESKRQQPLKIAFAGLVPDMVGFYQLTLRVPPGYEERTMFVVCESSVFSIARVPVAPEQ